MLSSKVQLQDTLEKMRGIPVLVIGDLILDRYIWGSVSRISPEAPVPVLEVRSTEDRLGGGGNVARNLRSLGAKVSIYGLVGKDDESQQVRKLLTDEGANCEGVFEFQGMPTIVKTRVVAGQQQIVRIDRELFDREHGAPAKSMLKKLVELMKKNRAVIVSDYGKGVVTPQVMQALEEFRESGEFSLKSRPLVVDPHPSNYGIYSGMTVAKPNRKEAEIASGVKIRDRDSAIKAAEVLLRLWKAEIMLISLGEGGLVIAFADGTEPIHLETRAQQVFDVSGAGDTVTAVFTLALAAGAVPRVAGDLANIAAGIVVSEVGTVAVDPKKLRQEVEKL